MTDVTNTITGPDESVQSTGVNQITGDKKADLSENLDLSNVVDSMEFFMMSNEVTEKFRKEIQQANIPSLKNVTMIDFSYRTNDREHFSEFLGLNLALEKILADPQKKIILTSLIDTKSFLKSDKVSEDKKDKLKLLLSKSNVKFLQVPYSLDQLGKVFGNQEHTSEEIIDSIDFIGVGIGFETIGSDYKEKILQASKIHNIDSLKDTTIIDLSYRSSEKQAFTEFLGLDLAIEKLHQHPEQKIILSNPISLDGLLQTNILNNEQKNKLKFLLSKPNVKFLEVLPGFEEIVNMINLFTTETNHISDIESETAFQKIMEGEISSFLHDAKYWISLGSGDRLTYEEQLPYLFNLAKDKKNDRWIEFEDKLISLLQMQHPSFKALPRENNLQWIVDMYKYSRTNLLPEGTRFEGVFVDWDGTLYDNKKFTFNQNIIDMIKDYEKQGKKITIRTGGNLEMKQKLLDGIGLHYTVENKTNYKGGTVEIAIDNDPQDFLRANAKIKSEHHIKV